MKTLTITYSVIFPIVLFAASCRNNEDIDSSAKSQEISTDKSTRAIDDEAEAIKMIESLPGLFDRLSREEISLDDLFNAVDPAICGEKADHICRYVTSNARAFAVKKSVDHDLLVSAETSLARYVYDNYPMAHQFFGDYDGVSKLNIEDLVDVWRHIPSPK